MFAFWAYGYAYATEVPLFVRSIHHHQSSVIALRAESLVISSAVNKWGCYKIRNIYIRWLTMSPLMFCLCCIFMQITIIRRRPQSINTCETAQKLIIMCHSQRLQFCWAFMGSLYESIFLSQPLPRVLLSPSDLKVLSINACTVTFDWKYWSGSYCCCTAL